MEDRKFLADIHMHSEYSHDCVTPVAEICEAALEKKLDLICITDHCDLYSDENWQAVLDERKKTVDGINKVIPNYPDLEVLVGVELGAGFIFPELAQAVIDSQPYDVVIGSVHGIIFRGERKSTSKFDFGAVDEAAMLEYLDSYMDAAIYIAEKLDIDVLAHMTYYLRYTNGKYHKNLDWRIHEDKIRRIFRTIIARGIALEINTSCVGSAYDEWIPGKEVIDLYLEMGGRLFTLGSDAHKSHKIGTGFEDVKNYLREKGIDRLVYFKKRVAQEYRI